MRNAKSKLYSTQCPDKPAFVDIGVTTRSQVQRMPEHDDRVGYGMRDGRLLFIADVPRGLACGCVCVGCGRPLIAKKGPVRRRHFAHREITDCRGAPETVLHRLSKELLAELDELMIPSYEFKILRKLRTGRVVYHEASVAKGGRVRVDRVLVEVSEEGFVPDVIVESGSRRLFVEVAVSHKVTRLKLRRMRRRDLSVIEITLEPSDSLLARDELKAKLQSDLDSKTWLFHPAQREEERVFRTMWRDARALDRMWSTMPYSRSATPGPTPRRSATLLHSQPPLSEYDRTAEEFREAHGRYPNVDECLSRWPHLWKRRQ